MKSRMLLVMQSLLLVLIPRGQAAAAAASSEAAAAPAAAAGDAAADACIEWHKVAPDDTCWLISRAQPGGSLELLAALNPRLDCDRLQAGQQLCVRANNTPAAPECPTGQWHVVQPGDDCDAIRQRYCLSRPFFYNTLKNNATCSKTFIFPGDRLCVRARTDNTTCASVDGACGIKSAARCPYPLCCSAFGFCNEDEGSCHLGCSPDWGECVPQAEIRFSFAGGVCGEMSRLAQGNPNKTRLSCPGSQCCSIHGWCGDTPQHCEGPAVCQPDFGVCGGTANASALPVLGFTYSGGPCGRVNRLTCPDAQACSAFGHCGYTSEFCSNSQPGFGTDCDDSLVRAALANVSVTQSGGACGPTTNLACPPGEGCSEYGWCGAAADDLTGDFCGVGCLPAFSWCDPPQRGCGKTLTVVTTTGAAAAQLSPPQANVLDLAVFAASPQQLQLPWHMAPLSIGFHNVRAPLMCGLLCDQTPECETWAFSSSNNTCYRSGVNGSKATRVPRKGWTSGRRQKRFGSVALPHTVAIQDNTMFFGAASEDGNPGGQFWFSDATALRLPDFGGVVASAGACEQSCKNDMNCRMFVFNKSTKQCYRHFVTWFGGRADKSFLSGIVRHGAAPRDRLISLNASDPAAGCRCESGVNPAFPPAAGPALPPGSSAVRPDEFLVPFVCQRSAQGPARKGPPPGWPALPTFNDNSPAGGSVACRAAGVGGPRACARGVQRCIDLCTLAKHGGRQDSGCDYYYNARATAETAFLGDECAWKVMVFGHLGERVLCDGRKGGKRGTGSGSG